MAIRNVGGQSVYVIDTPPAEAAKTSTGLGYAQLVSQLRWKIWEEAEKQVLRSLELEKMGYQAQLDAYVKQKQELTRALAKTKDLKEKVAKGDLTYSQAISLANADAAADRANQSNRLRLGTERVVSRPAIDPYTGKPTGEWIQSYSSLQPKEGVEIGGEVPRPSSRVGAIAAQIGVDTPADRKKAAEAASNAEVSRLEAEWMNRFKTQNPAGLDATAWSQSPEGQEIEAKLSEAKAKSKTIKDTPASQFKAEETEAGAAGELDDFASTLQRELEMLEAPSLGFDTNILSRTREAFGGMAGVGGFGFARRPSKISPIYDEERAREALARQDVLAQEFISATEKREKESLEKAALAEKERRRASRLAELETVVGPLATPEQVSAAASEAGLLNLMDTSTLTDAEKASLARVARERAQALYREQALLAGPGERTAGTFMDRPREVGELAEFTRTPREPRVREERIRPSREELMVQEEVVPTRFGTPPQRPGLPPGSTNRPPSFEELDAMSMGLSRPPVPSSPITPSSLDLQFLGAAPEQSLGITPAPALPPRISAPPPSVPSTSVELGTMDIIPTTPAPPTTQATTASREDEMKRLSLPPTDITGRVDLGNGIIFDASSKTIFGKDGFPIFVVRPPMNPNLAAPYQPEVISEEEMKKKIEEIRASGGYEVKGLKSEKAGSVKPKTRQEKYASTNLSIVKAGSALADKPAKLMRLAKLDLPEKERSRQVPEHILLVDKIYNINKGKANAYKATFDEIARVYKSDEKKKKEAQEYLTATHLLYSEGLA